MQKGKIIFRHAWTQKDFNPQSLLKFLMLQFSKISNKAQILQSIKSVQSLSRVQFFVTQWTAARQASLSIINSWSLLKLMSIESVMTSNPLILCCPLLLRLQSFPATGSFTVSQLFASGGQSIGVSASASVLPMNIQD